MSQTKDRSLIHGNILKSLISFAIPVLLALLLQAMYGAADLIIVGQFADTYEQSGVASGSQLFNMITMVITALTMGVTVFVGDCIGAGKPEKAGKGIGTGIAVFAVLAVVVTALTVPFSDALAAFLHAPAEAFAQTSGYVKICGMGTVFITAYNVIGAVFRGMGDSKTPFVAQNNGVGAFERSRKALFYGIKTALAAGFVMGAIAFFAGDLLSAVFSSEAAVIAYAHDYLKAYAIDCLLTAVLFCFVGYFNGCGSTVFVMVQGVVGAFCVRIPAVYLMSQLDGASLFHIGLGTPISSTVQILLCAAAYHLYQKRQKAKLHSLPAW